MADSPGPVVSRFAEDLDGQVNQAVVSAIVSAYYPKLVNAADTARSRAQAAYAIGNALAGGLVGASLLTIFSNASTFTKIVGFVAVAVWILAALRYVRAVASPLPPEVPKEIHDANAFVAYVLSSARGDRTAIDKRQRSANFAAVLALSVTALSFALLLFGSTATFTASVALTSSGQQQMTSICGHATSTLSGNVTTASVGASFLVIELQPGVCSNAKTIRIPASYVGSVVTH